MDFLSKVDDMMESIKFEKLCLPSKIYLIMGVVSIIFAALPIIYGSIKYNKLLSMGTLSLISHYVVGLIIIIFWTFILQLLCTSDYEIFSWVIVISRIVFVFILTGMVLSVKPRMKPRKNRKR